jgi:CheY-like chemotaxis protein
MKILIAEDGSTNRLFLKKLFETNGHEALTVSNGAEAIAVLGATQVDCLVTDLTMPVLDGWGLIRRIRERPEWAGLPIVLLTGSAEIEDVKRARAAGLRHYVVKPIDPDRVLAAVAAAASPEARAAAS